MGGYVAHPYVYMEELEESEDSNSQPNMASTKAWLGQRLLAGCRDVGLHSGNE